MTFNMSEIVNSLESNSVLKDYKKLQSFASESTLHMHLKHMGQHEAAWLRAMQPLSTLESLRLHYPAIEAMESLQKSMPSNLLGDAFKAMQSSLSLADQIAKSTAHLQISSLIKRETEQIEQIRKTVSGSMNSMSSLMGNSMLAWSTEMEKMRNQFSLQNDTLSDALRASSLSLDLTIAKQLRIPVIDQTAATLLAGVWGKSGITRQLDALGIDLERIYREIEQQDRIDHSSEPSLVEEHPQTLGIAELLGQPRVSGPLALLGLLLSIYQILLVYFPTWSPQDSAQQQQARYDKLEKHLTEKFQPLLDQILNAATKQAPQPEFVVKERVASVRNSPENGSTVIAEIFPNQGVTMLNESGKWIEIEYYDWLHQEFRKGWALKKYFSRLPISLKSTRSSVESP